MSYEEISAKVVKKGRKQYACEWCATAIAKGETHFNRVYKFEGDFHDERMHSECLTAMERSPWDLVSEGWIAGEQGRGEVLA